MSEVEKIVIHYKNEKPRVIRKGLACYFENGENDLMAEFARIDEKDITPVLNGLSIALKMAKQNAPRGAGNGK